MRKTRRDMSERLTRKEGKGREGKGREGKGREGERHKSIISHRLVVVARIIDKTKE